MVLGHSPQSILIQLPAVQVFASDLESGITTTMKATFWARILENANDRKQIHFKG